MPPATRGRQPAVGQPKLLSHALDETLRGGTVLMIDPGGGPIAELRRRNIFRVAVLYAAASWLVLDLCALCVAEVGLAPWVFRFLFALALICFPLALVLSWIYEITPEGLRRGRDVLREDRA